ncbi:hypothetical protein [Runella sp.]|uniref:hypothetical protein n=1 Tax=Runella sp. TaxID=1960881 RepID=UPI003D0B15AB
MKKLIVFGLLAVIGIRCKSSALDAMLSPESGCVSAQPTLIGKWNMVEFRYFGGCCPVIADSSWKKAPENSYTVEFTADGKVMVTNAVSGSNGVAPAQPAQLSTSYTLSGKEITLGEQILGGATWEKKTQVVKLTTRELVLGITVGKEGETNERRFARSCQ